MRFLKYLSGRLAAWFFVIFIGITFMFFIPRIMPTDPVESMISMMLTRTSLPAEQIDSMRQVLRVQYGLEGTLWEQYTSFLQRSLRFDFGPSLQNFPASASGIVLTYLPYTTGLTLFSLLSAWTLGNLIGMMAGFRKNKRSSKILESLAIFIYPIPYFILALVLQIIFCFILKWFPITTSIMLNQGSRIFIMTLLRASILPAFAMIIVGFGWWVISMKAMSQNIAEEEFVRYARFRGIKEGRIANKYVFRNSIIPQVSGLTISLGGVFGGSLMTEIIFQYPGVGRLVQSAIMNGDYNMIMATVSISIVAIATATLIADLIYPIIDPRIRLR
ncbi:MAG: ABC transporter permease [Oscillospiraceae bacterium]|nr:ABC transporter permease [Oscillospiraceae bacterium]